MGKIIHIGNKRYPEDKVPEKYGHKPKTTGGKASGNDTGKPLGDTNKSDKP